MAILFKHLNSYTPIYFVNNILIKNYVNIDKIINPFLIFLPNGNILLNLLTKTISATNYILLLYAIYLIYYYKNA